MRRPGISARQQSLAAALAMVALACGGSANLLAQEAADDTSHATYTLHVYTNLMQFPTIVLGKDLQPVLPVPRDRFSITIDNGPVFRPTQMRIEGNDAISLAVFVDVSGSQEKLIQAFAEAFSELAPAFLHPNDRVTLYAQDCRLLRTLHDQPPERESLRLGMEHVLNASKLHGDRPGATCRKSLALWDGVDAVIHDLSDKSARRVVLAVTRGEDSKSKRTLAMLEEDAGDAGVAVFRLRDSILVPYDRGAASRLLAGRFANPAEVPVADAFAHLCATTGGMDLDATSRNLARRLQDFITLLRSRYIIEFPRPDNSAAGHHTIAITVPGTLDFVRSTGGSAPLPDPAQLADPTVLKSAPSPAIVGKPQR